MFSGNNSGTLFSAEKYINSIIEMEHGPKINTNLFQILSPYSLKNVRKKKKEQQIKSCHDAHTMVTIYSHFEEEVIYVQNTYLEFFSLLKAQGFFTDSITQPLKNTTALKTSDFVYEESGKNLIKDVLGSNIGPATIGTIKKSKFIFPKSCQFYCKDINEIGTQLSNKKFDLILLDPPWWNKYIRRKRKKCPYAYEMMYNCDLKRIPIETLLNDTGIVVVWCTNSLQHVNFLKTEIFEKWKVTFAAKWYWLKVTVYGEPVCDFSKPPGKQPFEQILIGYKGTKETNLPPDGKLIVGVPSAIHSHKPPLVEILKPFLPENPICLELFARYLLPNWTSYGNEVLRLQHESLYTFN